MPNNSNNLFALEALSEAKKSPLSRQYGAVLIYNNKIISRGFNYYKSNITSNLKCCLL
jgi:deoxycytidylate deaminase